MIQDCRYALRLIRRQRAFAALIVGTLTLGIAAATAIFTVCDRVLLRPLPYPEPGQLVSLDQIHFSFNGKAMTVARDIASLDVFAAVGLYAPGGLNLGDDARPARVRAAAASGGFFEALGVAPAVGHPYTAEEDRDASPMAVLSYGAWQRHFGGDPSIVGRSIRLNSRSFTVTGVMPPGFGFPGDTDVWIPPGADTQLTGEAFAPSVIARLARGVTPARAAQAITLLNDARRVKNPDLHPRPPIVMPLRDQLTGSARPTLLFLAGVVGLLLGVACANVAGLLLARLRTRERELVVRAALGAGRFRLARQLVTECFTLTVIGGACGFAIAMGALRLFAASAPPFAANADLTSIDGRVFGVGVVVILLCGALFAAAPALTAGSRPTATALRESRAASGSGRWFRSGLIGSQVAASLVLLTATSAALAVVVRLSRVDVGFRNDHALVFELTLPLSRYGNGEAIASLVDRLESRLRAVPGVARVGTTNFAPGSSMYGVGAPVWPADQPEPPIEAWRPAMALSASPDYFRTIGVSLLAGRAFTDTDRKGAPRVVIVSESLARRLWGDVPVAAGRHLRMPAGRDGVIDLEVVGVVNDVRLRNVTTELAAQMYMPIAQNPPFGGIGVVIDAVGDPAGTLAAAQAAVREIDADLPPYDSRLIRDLRARFMAAERLTLTLTSAFALMTLVLCAIGVYGALSQMVAQRTREIGIRMALGAERGRLLRSFVLSGLRPALGGAALGLVVSGLTSRLIARFVPALDAPSSGSVVMDAVVLLAVALAAAWIPARRASAVDPMAALRTD